LQFKFSENLVKRAIFNELEYGTRYVKIVGVIRTEYTRIGSDQKL